MFEMSARPGDRREAGAAPSHGGPEDAPDSPGGEEGREKAQRRLSVRLAVQAVVCGRVGCRNADELLRVTLGPETRVLCSPCARGWLQ